MSTDRVQKLKDARSQATKEIEEYKKAKEQEFKAFESSVCLTTHLVRSLTFGERQYAGTTSNAQTAVDKETDIKLQVITESYQQNKDAVVQKLLDRVVLVKPELHRNLKKVVS
jgi:V-type H+-transporting ATPase subunit G